MSAKVRASLEKLYSATAKLEKAVDGKAAQPQGKKSGQPDLFNAQGSAAQGNVMNVRMLATRLDSAIEQVEQILKEGRG